MIILIVIGRVMGFDGVLRELQAAHPAAAIIGGIATGSWLLHAHAHKARFVKTGVVGLCFGGNVPLRALVCPRGAAPRLKEAKAELDGQQQTTSIGQAIERAAVPGSPRRAALKVGGSL